MLNSEDLGAGSGKKRSVSSARSIVGPAVFSVADRRMRAGNERIFAVPKKALFALVLRQMGQKNTFFEKRTGEVVENKGKLPKNEPET
ncbi:MAG TPA: hypothetical protein VFQ24_10530, partial [Terriglobia bacterium]|nr:hypothetical protein [Terriglobia bacterium]